MAKTENLTLDEALSTGYVARHVIWKALQTCQGWIKTNRGASRAAPSAPTPESVLVSEITNATSIGGVIEILSQLTGGFGEASAVLRDQQTAEAARLAGILEEKTEVTARLKKLFKIKVTGEKATPLTTTLESLIAQFDSNEETFDSKMQENAAALKLDLDTRQQAWNTEVAERQAAVGVRLVDRGTNRVREQAQFDHNLELQTNRENDEFRVMQKNCADGLTELSVDTNAKWSETEKEVAEREAEYSNLRTQVDKFANLLNLAETKGISSGVGIARKNSTRETRKLESEFNAEESIRLQQIVSLETRSEDQAAEILRLTAVQKNARQRFQELSTTIVKSASNADALENMTKLAMEQAGSKKR